MTKHTDWSRRGFIKGALLGGMGAMAADPMAMAQALLSGRKPEDIQGYGLEKGRVNLSSNENPLGPSPRSIEAVARHMFDVNRYGWSMSPSPEDMLRNAIERRHGLPETTVTMENWEDAWKERRVLISAGSGPILQVAAISTIKENAEMIQGLPAYSDISEVWSNFKKEAEPSLKINFVRLTRDYKHNLDAMYKKINSNTTLMVVTNPNNPTGTLVEHDALVDFVQSIPKHVMVFLDEAYIDYTRDPDYQDVMHLASEHENVIVARTFSKIYGLAGMRVGYSVAHPALNRKMGLYPLAEPGVLGAYAAAAALEDKAHYERCRKAAAEGKVYLSKAFERLGLEYVPSDGSFMLFNLKRDVNPVFNALMERKVEIADAGWWGLKEHLRVTVGTPAENEAFINTLEQVL